MTFQIKEFADKSEQEVFVIGGAEIFKEILPVTDRLYITEIDESFEGDTYFPAINDNEWEKISSIPGIIDEKNRYPHDFVILQKKMRNISDYGGFSKIGFFILYKKRRNF